MPVYFIIDQKTQKMKTSASSASLGQRSSTRQVKLSKAFRVVDEDTRQALAEQRLNTLEQDNYNEREIAGYQDDDFSDVRIGSQYLVNLSY